MNPTNKELSLIVSRGETTLDLSRFDTQISSQASKYRYQHNLPLNSRGLETSHAIIIDAIAKALNQEQPTPTKPAHILQLIKIGLNLRDDEMQEANNLIHELEQPSTPGNNRNIAYDLGINHNLLIAAKQDTLRYHSLAEPTNIQKLIFLATARKRITPIIASRFLDAALQSSPANSPIDFASTQIHGILTDQQTISRVIRGLLATLLANYIDESIQLDPLIFTPKDLETISSTLIVADSALSHTIAKQIISHLNSSSRQNAAVIQQALTDYSLQIFEIVHIWRKTEAAKDTSKGEGYWNGMLATFNCLPISPLIGKSWAISAAELETALEQNYPHIWQSPHYINGLAIPSIGDLAAARASIRDGDGLNARNELSIALDAWRTYTAAKSKYPAKIERLKTILSHIPPPPTADQLISELTVSLGISPDQLGYTQAEIEQMLLDPDNYHLPTAGIAAQVKKLDQYNLAIENQTDLAQLIKLEASVDSPNHLKFLQEYLRIRIADLDNQIERLQQSLYGVIRFIQTHPSWMSFSHPQDTRFNQPTMSTGELTARLQEADNYLHELEENPNLSLPSEFTRNKSKLLLFINWYVRHLPPQEKDRNRNASKLINNLDLALQAVNQNNIDGYKDILRPWFIDEVEQYAELLERARDLSSQISILKSDSRILKGSLKAGNPQALLDRMNTVSPLTANVSHYKTWIRARLVPEDILSDTQRLMHYLSHSRQVLSQYYQAVATNMPPVPPIEQLPELVERITSNIKIKIRRETVKTRVLSQLVLGVQDHNPLIPYENCIGKPFSELFEALRLRNLVAEATLEREKLEREVAIKKALSDAIRKHTRHRDRQVTTSYHQRVLARLESEVAHAQELLLSRMQTLGFAIEPERLKKN